MADHGGKTSSRPIPIAPAPIGALSTELIDNVGSSHAAMPYTCQNCAKRKVKCDKATPTCSTCRKGKLKCIYQAPQPRRQKRKLSRDIDEKLARYERILREHGLPLEDSKSSSSTEGTSPAAVSLRFNEPETARLGTLLAGQGKSRYIDSNLWHGLGDDEMQRMSDGEEEAQTATGMPTNLASDPLTGVLMGSVQSLLQYHPNHAEAMILWTNHIENVEPLCKILHIPSTARMVEIVSRQPSAASKSDECLLFAIYYFASFSMTEEGCVDNFGQSRGALLQRYHFATRQALINASFLKATEISILQAFVLFLLPCRYIYDPHTYWILTGVAIRMAQRMGLHRDGEKLGLPPFDVQMRRRLFYQIIPLDGIASQMSGTGISIMPDTWDTLQPLNINDDQIWPGMTETPEEQNGASEMIFCLARSCIGKFLAKPGRSIHGAVSQQYKDYNEIEPMIKKAESEVEEKYIRYCDVVDPLHFLAMATARSAITAIRLRVRLQKLKNHTVTETERNQLEHLSLKILDTDTAAYAHASLKKYRWHMRSFFLWGSWDSLIFILTSLRRSELQSPSGTKAAWSRLEHVYKNHSELLEWNRALHIAVGRITLDAWKANPPNNIASEPDFILALNSMHRKNRERRSLKQNSTQMKFDSETNTISSNGVSPVIGTDEALGTLREGMNIEMINDFDLGTADWGFWDQLVNEYQTQVDQEQYGLPK